MSSQPYSECQVNVHWSISRTKGDWVRVLERLGVEMSQKTFQRRLADKTYRTPPGTAATAKAIRIDIETLPAGYSDEITVRGKQT